MTFVRVHKSGGPEKNPGFHIITGSKTPGGAGTHQDRYTSHYYQYTVQFSTLRVQSL